MKQRRNEEVGETGDPRENLPINGIVVVGAAMSVLASCQSESGSIPGEVTPGFFALDIVPDDAASRRVLWVTAGFPRLHSEAAPYPPRFHYLRLSLSRCQEPLKSFTPLRRDNNQLRFLQFGK
ncbi:hypothetical protein PR048_021212 [Dryococelus australis]|uniref:Uncharacterized protein n=1 Tax=Dryococelus australis TaxID=614101 RepID=A0ABQ9GXK7_9NEOP|nr:hypothetical protein PR048_021212 [Dryococelus australis]